MNYSSFAAIIALKHSFWKCFVVPPPFRNSLPTFASPGITPLVGVRGMCVTLGGFCENLFTESKVLLIGIMIAPHLWQLSL